MTRRVARNRVRIVSGHWRSRLLAFPDVAGLRPTPDRVRETVFNWLGQDLSGKSCLDLYAGSGVLGFEAASRNARRVVMVERDALAMRYLQDNRRMLNAESVELRRGDALEFLACDAQVYDIVFADPPYAAAAYDSLFVHVRPRLAANAVVYVEGPVPMAPRTGWEVFRSARAGAVHYQLIKADPS